MCNLYSMMKDRAEADVELAIINDGFAARGGDCRQDANQAFAYDV